MLDHCEQKNNCNATGTTELYACNKTGFKCNSQCHHFNQDLFNCTNRCKEQTGCKREECGRKHCGINAEELVARINKAILLSKNYESKVIKDNPLIKYGGYEMENEEKKENLPVNE